MNPMVPSRQIESFADLPTSDRKIRRLGIVIIAVIFGLFGTWAAVAPLDGAAYAPGVVTVQAYRKTVQHLEGGIVKALLAHYGDIVKRDDPLIILDDAQLRFEYEMARGQLIAARAMEARLVAERDSLPAISFGNSADLDSVRGMEARQGETRVFNARQGSRLGQIAVLRERIGQFRQQIKGLESMVGSKVHLEKSYSGEIEELTDLLKQGFVDKQRLLEQERKLGLLHSEVEIGRAHV